MRRLAAALVVLAVAAPAFALSNEAREFMAITKELEPVQCEKRKLRRELAMAQVAGEEARVRELQQRFATLNAEPKTEKLEKRLGVLYKRMSNGKGGTLDAEDLEQISAQQRQMFYLCQ